MLMSEALKTLAVAYTEATGKSLSWISAEAGQHEKFFSRVVKGHGVQLRKAEEALLWFSANWPDGVEWPREVSRPVTREAAE